MIDIISMINFVLLLFVLLSVLAIACSGDLLVSTVLLSMFSLLMTVTYLAMDAPDVAITEAAVGAGISTVILLSAISLIGRKGNNSKKHFDILSLISVLLFGVGLFCAIQDVPEFGWSGAPAHGHIFAYYMEGTKEFMGFTNVVAAILASFRGYDTLGETSVILVASISVMLLLQNRDKDKCIKR